MTDAGLYGKGFHQFLAMDHLTDGIFIHLFYDDDKLWRKAIVMQQSPDDLSIDAVKCLLEFNKDSVQGGLPLPRQFDDNAHGCDMVRT